MQPPTKRFYIYNLTDPHDKIFYVGKGCGPRVFDHENEARRGCECHKCRKIRKIWRNGGEVRKYYVFETDNEEEAYSYEMQLISEIGLKNLCNKAIGGRGGRSISDDDIARWRFVFEAEKDRKMIEKDESIFRAEQIKHYRDELKKALRIDAEQRKKNNGLPSSCVLVWPSRKKVKKR